MPTPRKIMGYIVSGSCGVMGVTAYEDGIIVLCYGNGAQSTCSKSRNCPHVAICRESQIYSVG